MKTTLSISPRLAAALLVATLIPACDQLPGPLKESVVFTSGNQLRDYCSKYTDSAPTTPPDAWRSGLCSSYVVAISDVMDKNAVDNLRACIPRGNTQGQIVKIAIKHLREHPEQLHSSAYSLVAVALSEAFPCKK